MKRKTVNIRKIRFVLVIAVLMTFSLNLASQTIENSKSGESSSKCLWVGTVEVTYNGLNSKFTT